MGKPVRLSEDELVELTLKATRDAPLPLTYGPGWAEVDLDDAPWVIPIIAELRGIAAKP